MKTGLRERLIRLLQVANGETVPINEIERMCKIWGYKISNYERRLRPSETPNVISIKKNGAIIGYQWAQAVHQSNDTAEKFLRDFPPKSEEEEPLTLGF
jgi:predicted transcriptional regulator